MGLKEFNGLSERFYRSHRSHILMDRAFVEIIPSKMDLSHQG